MSARVTFLTRAGCHLCEEALAVVSEVCTSLGQAWEEVDVDGDPALLERYNDQVPVVLIDGAQHAFWHVDEARLRAALSR